MSWLELNILSILVTCGLKFYVCVFAANYDEYANYVYDAKNRPIFYLLSIQINICNLF